MSDFDESSALDSVIESVKVRTRFGQMDNMITALTRDEYVASIYDAIDLINSAPPASSFTFRSIYEMVDTRLKLLVVLGASMLLVRTLIFDWTAHGLDSDIGEFSIPNRLGDYKDLFSMLEDEFNSKLEVWKKSMGKYSRVRLYRDPNHIYSANRSSLYSSYRISRPWGMYI